MPTANRVVSTTITLLASVALAGCQTLSAPQRDGLAPPAKVSPFAWDEADIATVQAAMAGGRVTSRELTEAYLQRIAEIDDAGPTLNAVIETNPDALAEADGLDQERAQGRQRGPLHGIPVLIKDNIDTTPMRNSAGSLALADHRPTADAVLVRQLRQAGAVILGKTNLSEWANFRASRSASGWSARGGQTRNPYVLDRSPCGSSSGTGSAIAANLAMAGIGTETNGSIICPASIAGLVGIKPTVGLVSREGIIPISRSQDTAGPMARTVADAAAVLTALVSVEADAGAPAGTTGQDYSKRLDPGALRNARIGVLRKSMGFHPGADAAMERALDAMRAAGATVVEATVPTEGQWDEAEYELMQYEFKDGLNTYLRTSNAPVQSLADVIAFNSRNATTEMPWFGQDIFELAQAKGPLTDKAYRQARAKARRLARQQGIDVALKAQRLDALVAPAIGPAWPIDPINGDHFLGASYGVAAVAGTPSISVPMAQIHGLPVAIVFMGAAWSEPRLIELAHAFEQNTRARRPPTFLPTLPTQAGSQQARSQPDVHADQGGALAH